MDFISNAEPQAAFGLIISFLSLVLALLAQHKRGVVFAAISSVLILLAALDLMTNTMSWAWLAWVTGVLALAQLACGLWFVYKRSTAGAIGYLFAASFYGLMAVNLGIGAFNTRSEWWYNFQTFDAWATGAAWILLLPAIIVAGRAVIQVFRMIGANAKKAEAAKKATKPPAAHPAETRPAS